MNVADRTSFEAPGNEDRVPTADELSQAAVLVEQLDTELKSLLLNRKDLRRDLKQAVADGERMLAELCRQ